MGSQEYNLGSRSHIILKSFGWHIWNSGSLLLSNNHWPQYRPTSSSTSTKRQQTPFGKIFFTLGWWVWNTHSISQLPSRGVFQLEMVKIVLTSHFHKKVRAIIGLVPTSQLPWWCYIENERTIWERNGLIETPTLRGIIAKSLREKAWNPSQLSDWKTPKNGQNPWKSQGHCFW